MGNLHKFDDIKQHVEDEQAIPRVNVEKEKDRKLKIKAAEIKKFAPRVLEEFASALWGNNINLFKKAWTIQSDGFIWLTFFSIFPTAWIITRGSGARIVKSNSRIYEIVVSYSGVDFMSERPVGFEVVIKNEPHFKTDPDMKRQKLVQDIISSRKNVDITESELVLTLREMYEKLI